MCRLYAGETKARQLFPFFTSQIALMSAAGFLVPPRPVLGERGLGGEGTGNSLTRRVTIERPTTQSKFDQRLNTLQWQCMRDGQSLSTSWNRPHFQAICNVSEVAFKEECTFLKYNKLCLFKVQ